MANELRTPVIEGYSEDKAAAAAYDAERLIGKTRGVFEKSGVLSPSREQIVGEIQTVVRHHRDDYEGALAGAVEGKLFTEDEMKERQAATAREGVRGQYGAFIDDLNLPEADAVKLKDMMTEANYRTAVETAKEEKASRIPTFEQIVAELMTLTPERFREICAEIKQPTLAIKPDRNFDENIASMNENKHYTSADGQPQEDAYVYRGSDSPYKNFKNPSMVGVGITDGIPHPEQLTGVSAKLGERRDYLMAKLRAKGMRLIRANEMTGLIQQSLKKAEAAGDNSLIVDNWEDGNGTITILDPRGLTESTLVAFSGFLSNFRQAGFGAYNPNLEGDGARGRAWVQVLEI